MSALERHRTHLKPGALGLGGLDLGEDPVEGGHLLHRSAFRHAASATRLGSGQLVAAAEEALLKLVAPLAALLEARGLVCEHERRQ